MTSDSASRVMRSKYPLALATALFAAGVVAVTATSAQQAPSSAQTTTAATAKDAPATAPAASAATPASSQPPATAKPPAAAASRGSSGGQSPEHFEPTEKVRADFDVSFPVDI
jgi:hypothetical protein